jgi:hypothetical protein
MVPNSVGHKLPPGGRFKPPNSLPPRLFYPTPWPSLGRFTVATHSRFTRPSSGVLLVLLWPGSGLCTLSCGFSPAVRRYA